MNNEYEKIKEEYLRISSETRSKLTAQSITVLVAIYFFLTPENGCVLKFAFLFFTLTIFFEILSGFLKSQHYSLWFDGKISSTDYRKSWWGIIAEYSFWVPLVFFFIGYVLFFIGIFI